MVSDTGADLLTRSHVPEVTYPRFKAMYLLSLNGASIRQIACLFERDRASIQQGILVGSCEPKQRAVPSLKARKISG